MYPIDRPKGDSGDNNDDEDIEMEWEISKWICVNQKIQMYNARRTIFI